MAEHMTIDDLRAAVMMRRDGSVVMRNGGQMLGLVTRLGPELWRYNTAKRSGVKHQRRLALDALLGAYLEHEWLRSTTSARL